MLDLTSWLAVLFPLAGIDDRVEGIKRDLRDAMEECPEGEVIKLLRTITKDKKNVLANSREITMVIISQIPRVGGG